MSKLLARIMLAILMVPSPAIISIVSTVMMYESNLIGYPYRNRSAWFAGTLATWTFVGVYWILLWRKSVQWTPLRKRMTLLSTGGAAIVGGVAGLATRVVDDDFGFFVFATVTILLWLTLTVFIWRESAAERAARSAGNESA